MPLQFESPARQILLIVQLFADYLVSFFLPLRLSPAYIYDPAKMLAIHTFLSICLVIAVAILFAIGVKRKWRKLVFGLAWFAVCFAPFSQIIPIMIIRADHYMYHTLIGPAVIAVSGLLAVVKEDRARTFHIPDSRYRGHPSARHNEPLATLLHAF